MKKDITGLMVYYYFVCHRKLWYFTNEILMEQNSQTVSIGAAIDQMSYNREDKHINIDNVINIDFYGSDKKIHEVKKSRSIEEATIWQMKYYLYYLHNHGVHGLTGEIDYPLLKIKKEIVLEDDDIITINNICEKINEIAKQPIPPAKVKQSICKKCAYFDLCFM